MVYIKDGFITDSKRRGGRPVGRLRSFSRILRARAGKLTACSDGTNEGRGVREVFQLGIAAEKTVGEVLFLNNE